MNQGKTVFAQPMDLIPAHELRSCVERYHDDRRASRFSC